MTDETSNQGTESTETTQTSNSESTVATTTTAPSWFDTLPDDLKTEGSLQSLKDKDLSEVAKSYVHAQKAMGSMVRIPSADSPEEVRKAFMDKLTQIDGVAQLPNREDQEAINNLMNRLGRPEKAENYTLPEIEGLDAATLDVNTINGFKSLAHTIGLTDSQAKACMKFEIDQALKQQEALVTKIETSKATLKSMWGDSFEQRASAAKSMLGVLGQKYPELVQQFNSNYETNPLVYEVLAELAQVYRERGHISGSSVGKFDLTPVEARAKIEEMRSDVSGPLYNPSHPDHEAAVEKLSDLYRKAN